MEFAALAEDGHISADKLAALLLTTKKELGETIGVPPESLSRQDRMRSVSSQTALRHLIEILWAVKGAIGNPVIAFAWYRSEPIAGFGGRTPERIVKDGEFEGLRRHVQRRLAGGYA